MRACVAMVLFMGLAVASCGQGQGQSAVKGEQGEAGPSGAVGAVGPVGPMGPAGEPGAAGKDAAQVRFAEFSCQQATCSASCNDGERIMNAFSLNPGGTFAFEDDRRVTFRPARRPAGKVVLVCVPA
jgi:hypothetical protein